MGQTSRVERSPGSRWPGGHRGHLDGLRALSIVMVVAQHVTHTSRWYLGATGVALFFALSGYLITGLLLDELDRDGTVRLRRFYLRRSARLMPGLLLMLLVGSVLLVSVGAGHYVPDALPSALYLNNYASILAGPTHLNLVFGHTWSLAVEEHFYLAWPLLLVFGHRRLSERGLLVATLALCAGALGYRLLLALTVHPSDAFFYFDTLSRADSILYGCAAALAVRVGWRPRPWQLAAALVLLAGFLDAVPVLIGGPLGALVSGLACAVVVAGVDRGAGLGGLRRALGLRPLRRLGVWSYSVYLWHLPLIGYAIAVYGRDTHVVRLVAALLSLAVAAASHRWVESPVRDAVRKRTADPAPPRPAGPGPSHLRPSAVG